MKSHELLREVFQTHNPKQIAEEMGMSVSMVYKWAEPPEQGSGATNPLTIPSRRASAGYITRGSVRSSAM